MATVHRKFDPKNPTWAILLLSVILTGLTTYMIHKNGKREYELRLRVEMDEIVSSIKHRLERYELGLLHARAFKKQIGQLDQKIFNGYLRDTELMDRYPGMQGLAFIKRLTAHQIEAHLRERRKEDSGYKIWPQSEASEVTSIVYIAPDNWRNRRALGYDMMTDPIRRRAMEKARDSGKPSLSERLILKQEVGAYPQAGFILYVPLYGQHNPETTEERRKHLEGYITSPFRIRDLIDAIFTGRKILLDFEIYEGGKTSKESLLYDHKSNRGSGQKPPVSRALKQVLKFNKNSYDFYFYPGPGFDGKAYRYLSFLVAFLGSLITLLLMRIIYITRKQVEFNKRALIQKDEFLSIASHELKTPITSLQLQLEMVLRKVQPELGKVPSPESLHKALKNSIRQVFQINKLIDELLEITRIEKGKLTFNFEEVNFSALLKDIFEVHAEQVSTAGNLIEFQMTDNLWTVCDRFRIEQVVTNLLTNALKYGNGSLITVSLYQKESDLVFSIQDRGFGISPQFQAKIFERFERAELTRSISGLGLGLYISKQIITAHGGTIHVNSQEGSGAEFVVQLPIKKRMGLGA